MNRYHSSSIANIVAAIAAVAATAVTLAIAVLLPMAHTPEGATALAKTQAAPVEVAIVPNRIEVIGVRNDKSAAEDSNKPGHQS